MWEHFAHAADIGIRGRGDTRDEAFAGAALAVTAVVTDPDHVEARFAVPIRCTAPDEEILLVEWLNAVIVPRVRSGRAILIFRRRCARSVSR